LPQAESALREALEVGRSSSNFTGQIKLASGLTVFLNYSITPLYDQEARIIGAVLTFRDSTTTRAWTAWSNDGLGLEFDALFDNLAEGVFTVNNRWRITGFNQQAQEITGFKREEVLGRYCWDVFHSDRCRTDCPLKASLEDGITRTDQDVRMIIKGGRRLPILVNTSVIKNRRDLVVGAVQFFRPLVPVSQTPGADLTAPPRAVELIAESPAMKHLLALLPDIAASDATVILEGESGTGKDLFAQAIHYRSPRARGPFVAFSCSALVETLIESELFGHVKGAFTVAIAGKVGRFELAKGGTLFLDEIGDLKPELQTKLLRVLEERVFERVGSNRPIPLEARIIAATSRNLKEEVRRGRFREDLFYRLRTVPLYLPPLRERVEGIPLLVEHFIIRLNRKYKKNVRGVDPKVMTLFQQYSWPGNVRELERVLEYAFVFVKGPIITKAHLPDLEPPQRRPAAPARVSPQDQSFWEDERVTILRALEKARGRRRVAAQLLGISRCSLWRKMKAHGLCRPQGRLTPLSP
jgi:PAS domain S-box-containing protein